MTLVSDLAEQSEHGLSFLVEQDDYGSEGCVFESRRVQCSLSVTYALNQVSVSVASWTLLGHFLSNARIRNKRANPHGRNWSGRLRIPSALQCSKNVVGGFTEGKCSRNRLVHSCEVPYCNGKFYYYGHSGSGFSEKGLKDALDRMRPFFTAKSMFKNTPAVPEKING
jgi:hypothetical protein